MRIYVIGGEGQVARSLGEAAAADKEIEFGFGRRPDVDLLNTVSIERAIAAFRPDVVVNPAAYTAVDKAESEPDLAFALNRDGAGLVAAAAADHGIPVIHLSTDYVFDGMKTGAYVESDTVNPQSVYGRSKLAGELAVAAANPRHVILRTSWVYAPFGGNFVRTMLRLASERDRLRVVNDQVGCPTYAPDIADAIRAIARRVAGGWQPHYAGVTHLAGPDPMTWYAFAKQITDLATSRGGRSVLLDPISTSDYPTAALRPANSQLSSAKLAAVFDVGLPPLKQSLTDCLDRLLEI
ncbi:dTDP-4-dehydrorhamnose reductase [Bradyrhizobium sp. GM7.3]